MPPQDEADLATKSPENDAMEDTSNSLFPGDTSAQAGASLGEHCTTDRPISSGPGPSGEISKLGNIDVYISKPSDYPHAPSKFLLFLTGGTGLHSRNNQLQADKFAQEGYVVVMPDLFDNDPAPNSQSSPEGTNASIIEQIKMGAVQTVKSFMIDMWLARHTSEKVLPTLFKVIDSAREEFADTLSFGGGMYSVGYCFGARYSLLLASDNLSVTGRQEEEHGPLKNGPVVKAAAIAHGTLVTAEDFAHLKSPVLMICVENDALFPDSVRKEGEKAMEAAALDHKVNIYPNVPHGFAVYGDYQQVSIKVAQEQAFSEMLDFLNNH